MKDCLVGKAIDEDLGDDYPYVRVPLKGEKSEKEGEKLMMECSLLEDHSDWMDGYLEAHSYGVKSHVI